MLAKGLERRNNLRKGKGRESETSKDIPKKAALLQCTMNI
jgi:hypothetical protein